MPTVTGTEDPRHDETPSESLGVKPRTAVGHFRPEPDRSSFASGSKDWHEMFTAPLRFAMPKRLVAVFIAAMFGLTLAVNPVSAPRADAAVPARMGVTAVHVAAQQIGIPYVWGGASRRGFDCSGLSQYVFAQIGRRIPRVAQAQWNASIHLRPHTQRAGDLVFFFSGGRVSHMGIYAGNGWMIVAPRTGARVRKQRVYRAIVRYGRVR